MQGSLSIERMCQLAQVSRAGFYRSLKDQMPQEEDVEVRSTIQAIALEHRRRYGYRRISAELRRRGMPVNRKRVARIMREDNLPAIQKVAGVLLIVLGLNLLGILRIPWLYRTYQIDLEPRT